MKKRRLKESLEATMGKEPKRTAIITGSTRGIGKAIALRLAKEQYNVVVNYASDDVQAQETLKLCQKEFPAVLLVKADVANKRAVESLIGTPEDIANAVILLLSDDAQFINGQKIVVDGGQYMW